MGALHCALVIALAGAPVPVPDEVVREKSAERPRAPADASAARTSPGDAGDAHNAVRHDRVPTGESVLVTKTLEDALRRVPLLPIWPKMVLQVWSRRMGATVAWVDRAVRWPLAAPRAGVLRFVRGNSRRTMRGEDCGAGSFARRFGPSSACRLLCFLLTSAPRWRFLRTRSVRELPDTTRTSRGKTDRLHRTPAEFTTPGP